MKRARILHRALPAAALAAISVVAAYAANQLPEQATVAPVRFVVSPAEERFDDAPMGVDPMVTGPTSGEFRQRQRELRCDEATWPHIPLACYPD